MLTNQSVSVFKRKNKTANFENTQEQNRSIPTSRGSKRYFDETIPTPAREERVRRFGIDTVDIVHFSRWDPGGEYVRQVTVKNVHVKTQKLSYRLPLSKIFSMEFPEVKTLSRGMSWTIPITFRPVEKEVYEDVIEFRSSMGKFYLPVIATLAEHVLSLQSEVDFGFCPTMEKAHRTVVVRNVGELETYYQWHALPPFTITPSIGVLKSGDQVKVDIEFVPKDATLYEAIAICSYGDQIMDYQSKEEQEELSLTHHSLHIEGKSKYSFLMVQTNDPSIAHNQDTYIFDFDQVYVGQTVSKRFELRNLSQVLARFLIKRIREFNPTLCFEFSIVQGAVEPNQSITVEVTFTPVTPGFESFEYFDITTVSGNTLHLACQGTAIGPNVSISSNLLFFGDVEIGNKIIRSFTIDNQANIETFYQFIVENDTGFIFDKPFGIVTPESSLGINISFEPTAPIHYYKRVYVLLEHQQPLMIELIGTGYDEKRRPASFFPRHLEKFRNNELNGLSFYPPELIDDMINVGTLEVDQKTGFVYPHNPKLYDMFAPKFQPTSLSEKYFNEQLSFMSPQVHLETISLDFGSCSRLRIADPLELKVANHTKGKMTCHWLIPEHTAFVIQPSEADIPPKSQFAFTVHFRPDHEEQFYGQNIDASVFYKSMRNFRLVTEESFTPPWCLSVYLAGRNTFMKTDSFIPQVQFHTQSIEFPGCVIGEQIYRTVRVTNTGDTPVKYWFSLDPSNVFSAKPSVGLLNKNQSQLIMFRFSPNEAIHYDTPLICQFNTGSSTFKIQMKGMGCLPSMKIEPALLIMKPVMVHGATFGDFKLFNKTNIPVYYKWSIPSHYSAIVSILPSRGILKPNSFQNFQCHFSATTENSYNIKIPCYYADKTESLEQEILPSNDLFFKKTVLTVLGQGIIGNLKSNVDTINFGSILVQKEAFRSFILENKFDADIAFSLNHKTDDEENVSFQYEPISGIVPARSSINIKVKVKVNQQKKYSLSLEYNEVYSSLPRDSVLAEEPYYFLPQKFFLCNIIIDGVFPTLNVTDVRSFKYCKEELWRMFNLSVLNTCFNSPDQNDVVCEFNFPAATIKSQSCEVYFELHNPSVVDVEWSINMPSQCQIDLFEDEPMNIDPKTSHKLEQQLFEISPKIGILGPNQYSVVKFTYHYSVIGRHSLPVYLTIRNGPIQWSGRSRLLLLDCTTSPANECCSLFYSEILILRPIPVGLRDPPTQVLILSNPTDFAIEFEIDDGPCQEMKGQHNGVDVFKISSFKGEILPQGYYPFEVIFCPLEKKEYTLNLNLTINGVNGEICQMMAIKGSGIESGQTMFNYENTIPNSPSMVLPKQLAHFSLDRVHVGCIPVSYSQSHLVAINNDYHDEIYYEWQLPQFIDLQPIVVEPNSGTLRPGSCQLLKITLKSDETPRIYDSTIICHVFKKKDFDDYDSAVEAVARFRQEKKNNILSDREDGSFSDLKKSLEVLQKNSEIRRVDSFKNTDAPKEMGYTTDKPKKGSGRSLPPLDKRTESPADSKVNFASNVTDASSKKEQVLELEPEKPTPWVLTLQVIGQSMTRQEYCDYFPTNAFRCGPSALLEPSNDQTLQSISNEKLSVITDVAKDILIQIMQDLQANDITRSLEMFDLPFGIHSSPWHMKRKPNDPFFRHLAEEVIESTLFNLMQEVCLDEWEIQNISSVPVVLKRDSCV